MDTASTSVCQSARYRHEAAQSFRAPSPTQLSPTLHHFQNSRDASKGTKFPCSACSVCLGRHSHLIHKCENGSLWDGSDTFCHRGTEGQLILKKGTTICSDWQCPLGCKASGHAAHHMCSGCGSTNHGAQGCPRAEKAQSAHSIQP